MLKIMAKRARVTCPACHTKNKPHEKVCGKCGLSLTAIGTEEPERKITCPRCGSTNNAASFFCYTCGKYFADIETTKKAKQSLRQKRGAQLPSTPEAKVMMPGGTEMTLTGEPVFIERSDFNSTMSQEILMKVSRQHILITYDRGKYYVRDYGRDGRGSTNHTKLNGIDIYNKRKKSLKDGDKIELAGQPELTLTFRLTKEKK
jgi:DNA-directed RNA polymerase subunit RPC12/RpoP